MSKKKVESEVKPKRKYTKKAIPGKVIEPKYRSYSNDVVTVEFPDLDNPMIEDQFSSSFNDTKNLVISDGSGEVFFNNLNQAEIFLNEVLKQIERLKDRG